MPGASIAETGRITDFVVAGGGCFGSYHTRQLVKGIRRGRLPADRVLVVDRNANCAASVEFAGEPLVEIAPGDWVSYLGGYLETARAAEAHLVPPPIGPHVALEWLKLALAFGAGEATLEETPLGRRAGLPYEHLDSRGNFFLSHAGWLCPTNCYEPEVCPATRGPRDWSMPETVRSLAADARPDLDGVMVFHSRHLGYGISTIPMRGLLEARDRAVALAAAGEAHVMVATVSHCHGVLGVLRLPSGAGTGQPQAAISVAK